MSCLGPLGEFPFSFSFSSPLDGYEWPLFGVLFFVLVLFVFDVRSRQKMKRKRLVKKKKNPSLPDVIPFQDPLLSLGEMIYNMFTGNMYKLRHPKYLFHLNMESEKNNFGCKCRQITFLGWPMVVSWDVDDFREVSTNAEDYGKVSYSFFFFFFFFFFFSFFSHFFFLSSSLSPLPSFFSLHFPSLPFKLLYHRQWAFPKASTISQKNPSSK